MRVRCVYTVLSSLVVTSAMASVDTPCAPTHADQLKMSKSLPATIELVKHDKRLLRGYIFGDTKEIEEVTAEERALDAATLDKMKAETEAIIMRMAYKHWFDGGKTSADVRLIMGLPAKGDAAGHANWTAYLNYLKFVKEKEVDAVNAAKVEAIKLRLIYKGWFLERKTFKQVRAILGLPPKGDAVDHVNWGIFQNYLKFYKEYAQQFT
uniref:RxLR effector protein n=1 Tax=Phytophthora agathidicida TaxID=1642459 RepID=A0A7G4WHZ7_9STRA|nr:PaRXLR8 [Phytophthora agathidicida]